MAKQRIAVVTGGMGGLGETISTKMADAGYRVVVTYSPSNTKFKSWLEEMRSRGYAFSAFPVDVVDYDSCAKQCASIQNECGAIDILVNNAGITRDMTFKKMTKTDWDAVMRTNLESVWACGDITTFDGKLKLIATGFAEAAIAVAQAVHQIRPDMKIQPKYSTNTGVPGGAEGDPSSPSS